MSKKSGITKIPPLISKKEQEELKKNEERLFFENDGINKFEYFGSIKEFDLKDYIFYNEMKGSYYPDRSYRFYGKRTSAGDYDKAFDPDNNKYLFDVLTNELHLFRLHSGAYLKYQAKNIIEYLETKNT